MMRELRAQLAPTTDGTVRGYAALFDSWSLPITERGRTFRERIKPGALQPDGNVSLWWMHDHTDPLANTRGGSLTITEDAKGIAFVADLGTSPRADEIRDLIRRGVVDQMSIGFVALADIWDGNTSRTITKATLHEVSLVESAAYPGTSATVRNHQRKPAMSVKEDRARIAELNAEYNTATDERQFAIMDEVTECEERIAGAQAAFTNRAATPLAVAPSAPLAVVRRITPPVRDEQREWFRTGFKQNRSIGLSVTGGNAAASTTLPTLSGEFVKALDQESVMRSLATVETRGLDTDIQVIGTRQTAVLLAEKAAYTSTDFTATKLSFKSYKSGALTDVTEEALQDTVWDVASQVVSEHARAHSRLWENYYINGTGTSQPQGAFAATWTTTQTAAASLSLPVVADLVAAAYKLPTPYQANASWLMHSTVWAAIVGSAASGKYLLNGENGNILKDGAVALFLGKPVYLSEWAPTAITAGTVSCLFGDFKAGYRIIDRSMLSFTVDDVSQMSNGLIRYTSRMRSDAKAVDATAIVSVVVKA